MRHLSIVIQAGGNSSRMGSNKSLKPFLGIPLIQRVIERVKNLSEDIFIVTNTPGEFAFLNLRMVSDELPGRGVISGLYTAMIQSNQEFVGVIACDMPFVNADLILAEYETLVATNADVAIPRTRTGYEPLHAVYRRKNCLTAIRDAIQQDQRRLISWLPSKQVVEFDERMIEKFDPKHLAFINTNTQEEFSIAEQIAIEE